MKKKVNIKSKLAVMLAAAMVFTMAAPAGPAYAETVDTGGAVRMIFDPKDGPGMNLSSYAGKATDKVYTIDGHAGDLLKDNPFFSGLPTETFGSGERPLPPAFVKGQHGFEGWPGFTFMGWYDGEGIKVDHLPFAFQYNTPVTYEARWNGTSGSEFDFTVEHYRDFRADTSQWPDVNPDPNNLQFYTTAVTPKMANSPISATYRRDIPGYKCIGVLIKNNQIRKYGEASGAGSGDVVAKANPTTNGISGSMPNDNLTVCYKYGPDTNKTFPITVKYVDASNRQIRQPDTYRKSVETDYTVTPPDITDYKVDSVEMTNPGVSDLRGKGIVQAGNSVFTYSIGNDKQVTGKMPNQGIVLTYKYKIDSTKPINITVTRTAAKGPLKNAGTEIKATTAGSVVNVEVKKENGYNFPPNISWDNVGVTPEVNPADTYELPVTATLTDGSVTIQYTENTGDQDFWGKVEFYSGPKGHLTGDTTPKLVARSEGNTLSAVLGEDQNKVEAVHDAHYSFDGWYYTEDGSSPNGSKLEDDSVIKFPADHTKPAKLLANFVETPGEWYDLNFVAGSHGTISGNKHIHTVKDTLWSSLTSQLPSYTPDTFYKFDGWYRENGTQVLPDDTISANQTYEARFVPNTPGLEDDGALAMPDAQGVTDRNGRGRVTVSGPNENRRYALTDADHQVMDTKIGGELKNSSLGLDSSSNPSLNPCASYYVYELPIGQAVPGEGTVLPGGVDHAGPGARVTVPALGGNYRVEEDVNGRMKVVVTAASADTEYAVLDMDGTQVIDWTVPVGSPLQAVLGGLTANQSYVIVAKQQNEAAEPEDKFLLGTQVAVLGNAQDEQEYTVTLTNGGLITEIKRGDEPVDFENPESAAVKAGDKIKINTAETDSNGKPFRQWSVLLGSLQLSDAEKNRRDLTLTMPKGNLVLQANYAAPAIASSNNATVSIDYTPKSGSVALGLSNADRDELIANLASNDEDQAALDGGIDVRYTVKFNKRQPRASESDAARAQAGNDEVKVPWSLTSSLTRQVGGINKALPATPSEAQPITVYCELDRTAQGYMDYKLWDITDLEQSALPITMTPDPNDADSGFTGVVSFEGKVGSVYALTYLKAYTVTIKDEKKGTQYSVTVQADTPLEDSVDFTDLLNNTLSLGYEDPQTGIMYDYKGLGRTAASAGEYDTSDPVTKKMTLYVRYSPADDSEWQEARNQLLFQITRANDKLNDTSISAEDREALSQAVTAAEELANQVHRPAVAELAAAHDALRDLVDSIVSGGGDHPDNPGGGGDQPDNPGGGGGSGGGGSGGGGGGGGSLRSGGVTGHSAGPSFTFNGYTTFSAGADGQWEPAGADNSQWAFVLKSGRRAADEWANVRYDDARGTCTYHFSVQGLMDRGWYADAQGKWYYLDETPGANLGRLIVGWHFDSQAQTWYYLNQMTGSMATGWQKVGEDWYYLSPVTVTGHPMGSLYTNGMTPDGYPVDENGKWLRETP